VLLNDLRDALGSLLVLGDKCRLFDEIPLKSPTVELIWPNAIFTILV